MCKVRILPNENVTLVKSIRVSCFNSIEKEIHRLIDHYILKCVAM